jgi:acyl-CoA synthetase (AMP-forming)/AMP-acid ligase II
VNYVEPCHWGVTVTLLLHDVFDFFATTRGDLRFAVQHGHAVTYAHARQRANRFANAMRASGLGAGDRLAVVGSNSIDLALLYYAASKVGVVPVPLNPRLTPSEIAFIVTDSGARAVLADAGLCGPLGAIRDEMPNVHTWVSIGDDAVGVWVAVDAWIARSTDTDPGFRADPGDVLYQMYTSGTTGVPKGVLLTHRSVVTNCAQVSAGLGYGIDAGDRWLIVAPLFHAAAVITAFNCVAGGGCLVIHRGFDAATVVDALAHDEISLTTLVPSMIQACLAVPGVDATAYPALRASA